MTLDLSKTERLAYNEDNGYVYQNITSSGVDFGYRVLNFSSNRVDSNNLAMLYNGNEGGIEPDGRKTIVVALLMGGIGDILMMTAGLRELQAKPPSSPFHFMPCWLNEYSPCKLSGTKESQRTKAIRIEDRLEIVESKLSYS